jgi:type IX secretion system substrate protein
MEFIMKQILQMVLIIFSLLFCFSSNILSNTITINGSKTVLALISPSQGEQYVGYPTLGYDIGFYYSGDSQHGERSRTLFTFDISEISNATINSVALDMNITYVGDSYTCNVTAADYRSNITDQWIVIGSSTVLLEVDYYQFGPQTDPDLKTDLIANLGSSDYFLGAFSADEANNGSNANLSISLVVDYTPEPTTVSLTAMNDMDGYHGGNIGVGVNESASSGLTSPQVLDDLSDGDIIYLEAEEDQTNSGYNYIWNDTEAPNEKSKWEKAIGGNPTFISYNQSATYPVASTDNGANLVGYLKKVCNITLSNDFQATSDGGTITVDGLSVNAPTISSVVEGNTITATALSSYTVDEITHSFWYWDNDVTDNNRTKTFSISAHEEHVAHYKPSIVRVSTLDLTMNSYHPRIQQNIQLSWNEHPSPGIVEYIIRRGINHEAVTIIATVNRGTTTYTDGDFYLAADGTEETVKYCVTCQFSPYDTSGTTSFLYTDGEDATVEKLAQLDSISTEMPSIKEYALNSNFPNPFNPSTQISYQIPENSFVNLIVYNSLGQKVTELVNQHQSSGRYSVKFNAANLPSGVYIYKLQVSAGSTTNFSDVKKMLLTK